MKRPGRFGRDRSYDLLLNLFIRRSTLAALWEKGARRNLLAVGGNDVSIKNCRVVVLPRLRQCGSGNRLPGIVVRWIGCTPFRRPQLVPHNFLDLSILLFVISIASNARAMVHREDGKATATGRAA